ncbi:MAG: type II toxin-antitoxin system VapC family toxin [Alphaproteobacteria bacterium]|nr:type II toxin-antitoxin system VapC family toxin [Alphaproteobacteria bacterium]MBU2378201.1 type II toxin-antitoxin system VapC family toxin [Alphaproteobacteria bacterium]
MIVDTSALVAIVRNEIDKPVFFERLVQAAEAGEAIRMSAGTLVELFIVIDRFKDPSVSRLLDGLLAELALEIIPVERELTVVARAANRRFGKGFHPARLNFGDCFAYALAKQSGEPLLFKGEDFAQTDIVSAV